MHLHHLGPFLLEAFALHKPGVPVGKGLTFTRSISVSHAAARTSTCTPGAQPSYTVGDAPPQKRLQDSLQHALLVRRRAENLVPLLFGPAQALGRLVHVRFCRLCSLRDVQIASRAGKMRYCQRGVKTHFSTHSLSGAMPKNFSLLSPGLPGPLGALSGSTSRKSVSSMYTTLLRGTG